jgi:hypothetical protein
MSRRTRTTKLKAQNKLVTFEKFRKAKTFTEVLFDNRFSWEQILVMDHIDLNNATLRPLAEHFLQSLLEVEDFLPFLEGRKHEKMTEMFTETKFNNIYQIFDTVLAHLFPLNLPKLGDPTHALLYIPK